MQLNEYTVFVVDDDARVRALLCRGLKLGGFSTVEAADGLQAMQLIDECERAGTWPFAVTLDLAMPETDGLTVLQYLRDRNPYLPVVVISGNPDLFPAAVAAGATMTLAKPFTLAVLLEIMRQLEGPEGNVEGFEAELDIVIE